MLLRQKPNRDDMIVVTNDELNRMLQSNNFHPTYFDDGKFFYKKDERIVQIINQRLVEIINDGR